MKVKTDYSNCAYITEGKVYSIELDSDGEHTIIDDVGVKIWIVIDKSGCPHLRGNNWVVVSDEKPFDIAQHEFSDADVALHHCEFGELVLNVNFSCAVLCKQDAIAIAKALGVTGEDLL